MTTIENKILTLLQEDARYSAEELAVMVGSDKDTVEATIRGLEQKGAILGYTAVLNPEIIDEDSVSALIEVKVTPQARSGFDSFADRIAAFDEVKAVYLMSGTYDLSIRLEGKTLREISTFVGEKLSSIEGVTSTATHFIMKRYKEDGVSTESANAKNRVLPLSE